MPINTKRNWNGESPFRWLRTTQSPYYTFILWKPNFILTEHTINTFIFHVKYVFSPTFPSPTLFTNHMKTYGHVNFVLTCEHEQEQLTTTQPQSLLRRNTRTGSSICFLRQIKSCVISHGAHSHTCSRHVQSVLLLATVAFWNYALYNIIA
jgi:hypothetical protein